VFIIMALRLPSPSIFARLLAARLLLLALLVAPLAACQQPARLKPQPVPPQAAVAAPPATAAPAPMPAPESNLQLTPPPGMHDSVTVGFLVPLSGPGSDFGQALLNAAQMALFDLAVPDGGADVVLIPRDTKGTPEGAVAAATDALANGAQLLLGPLFSADVAAVAPVARERGVPVVAFTNDYAAAGNGVYILGFTPEMQVDRVVAYASSRGAERFAALVPDSVYGQRIADAVRAAVTKVGGTLSQVASYDASAATNLVSPVVRRLTNYDARRAALRTQRQELASRDDEASKLALRRLDRLETYGDVDFDAIVIPESGARIKAIAPLLPFYDVDTRKVHALGTVEWDEPEVWTEPALIGGWYPATPDAPRADFAAAYRKLYGSVPPARASLGYDAAALAAVLARGDMATRFSPEALVQPNGFSGVDGIFRLTPAGLTERGLAVKEIGARSSRVVSPAPATFEDLSN
jgi:ABC-type branched-subunit amino acid transport system substrate-binding protein